MNLSDVCTFIFIQQVFLPAKVIFAGVGVLLLVRILLHLFWKITVTYVP